MDLPLANPTLVLCLGRFGGEVAALLQRQADDRPPPNLIVLRAAVAEGPRGGVELSPAREVSEGPAHPEPLDSLGAPDDEGARRLLEKLHAEARRLLDLKQRVETTGAGDARPPRLDLFLVADLAEPSVAPLVPWLVEQAGLRLRDAFRPIFQGTGGRLTVCPLLAAPRAAPGREAIRAAVDALDALSRAPDERRRPLAPVYLIEDQTSRYVLAPEELVRTVAAYLHLVLYSGLRHHEDALRSLVEHDGEGEAPFASFACATLELDTRPLSRYCAGRLAMEIADAMLGEGDALGDIEAAARRLSPEGAEFEKRLRLGRNERPIGEELKLDRAALELSDPHWDDPPEAIEAHVEPYVRRVIAGGERQRAEIEDFKMESAARLVDEGGLTLLEEAERDAEGEISRCIAESPVGLEKARARMAALEARLARLSADSRSRVERPELPAVPDGKKLKSAHEELLAELEQRPRFVRTIGWGIVASAAMAVFLTATLRLAWRVAVSEVIPFTAAGIQPEGGGRFLAGWPWAAIWMSLIALVFVGFALYRHYRERHRSLCERFEALRRAARGHFDELERYYARRVAYSQDLWASRIATHLHARVEGERAILEAGRTALQKTREWLGDELAAEIASCGGGAEAGILFRGLLSSQDLASIYEAKARPQNPGALALRYLESLGASQAWRSGAFAERDALVRFAQQICPDLSGLQPFAAAEEWAGPARERAVEFLEQLAAKLSVPLELGVDTAGRSSLHVGYVPRESREAVEKVLADGDLAQRWSVREAHDPRRMHLFVAVRNIGRSALKMLEPEREEA